MKQAVKLGIGAFLLLVLYTVGLNLFTPDFLTEKVEVEVETTTEIDSARVYEEYSEKIPPEDIDTVFVTVEIPTPTPLDEHRNSYTTSYSDSLIAASWTSIVEGRLESQEFEYFIKRRIVREEKLTLTHTITTVRTETITKVKNPKPYFTAGAEFTNLNTLSLSAGYMTRSRYHFYYRHNLDLNSHSIGIQVPIRFNFKSLL